MGVAAASLGPAWPAPMEELRTGKGNFRSMPEPGKSDYEQVGEDEADELDLTMPANEDHPNAAGHEPVELTVEAARRAVDAFVAVRDKYNDEGLEDYNSLEEFVAETEPGKRLEAEVMEHGFADITDWNQTIMAVGFAYSAIVYDYASDLRQQIEAVRKDRTLDQQMRERLIAGLTALMPSRSNRTVLQALLDDPIYRERLKLLQEEE
jgi:hypothetical protein